MTSPAGGRPVGARNWDREPYRDSVLPAKTGRQVKINANIEPESRRQYHFAARAAGVSVSYLLNQIAMRVHIDEETGTVTLDGTPITSPRKDQEALVIPA